jgi:GTPase SAR1 family protein
VRGNTLQGMRTLISGCMLLEIPLDPGNTSRATRLDEEYDECAYLKMSSLWNEKLIDDINKLWQDSGVQEAYRRRNEFQCIENVRYYFDNFSRISASDYVPNHDDILMTRVKTVGAIMKDIPLNDAHSTNLKLIDVGGQRNERRKWNNFFEGVEVVIYLVAASEYNQLLYEDDTTNRMRENLELYCDVINNVEFASKPVILVLNKMDVFKEKMKSYDFRVAFPDYDGGQDPEVAIDYLKDIYEKKRSTDAPFYCFETMATDTEKLKETFEDICQVIKDLVNEKKKNTSKTGQTKGSK